MFVKSLFRVAVPLVIASQCGCCDSASIPKFIEKLDSQNTRERNEAALSLARCGSRAGKAVPRLAELLYDPSVGIQSSAAYALRQIDTPAARAVMEKVEAGRKR